MKRKLTAERKKMVIFLITIVSVLFALAVVQQTVNLSSFIESPEHRTAILLWALSSLNVVFLVICSLLLFRNLIKLYIERKSEQLGSKFRTKLVVAFLGMIFIPMLFMAFFSIFMLNRNIDKWFSTPIDRLLSNLDRQVSVRIQEVERQAAENALVVARQPALWDFLKTRSEKDLKELSQAFNETRPVFLAVADPAGKVLLLYHKAGFLIPGSPEFKQGFDFEGLIRWQERTPLISEKVLKTLKAKVDQAYSLRFWGKNAVLASVSVSSSATPGLSLYLGQSIPQDLMSLSDQLDISKREYQSLATHRKFIRNNYLLWMGLITLLILFAAVWIGLYLSRRITTPIQALAEAADQVSRGNLLFQINCPAEDELGILISMFNRMTAQLHESAQKVEQTNRELQLSNQALAEKGRYTEAVLENIPTGVISIAPDDSITKMNQAAQALLECSRTGALRLGDVFQPPDLEEIKLLLEKASRTGFSAKEMQLHFAHRNLYCAVTLSSLDAGPTPSQGFVMVIEDLTEVLKAQKANAWREVARRMAHEIKNPLTPIQLSAERLMKSHEKMEADPLGQAAASRENFRQILQDSVRTIVEESTTLKRMVDEFSRFARLPSANLVPCNLNGVIENTLASYNGRFEGVTFAKSLDPNLPEIRLDPEQIKRLFVNLFDNALEAMEHSSGKELAISTEFLSRKETIKVVVKDTGHGIDRADKDRLFLPYFSTKKRGTGLGLAIANRIVADHKGYIHVEDNHPSGTSFIIELPVKA
jgi:nitrogen fixation/metabolism regulation signal transduction histidine kinase